MSEPNRPQPVTPLYELSLSSVSEISVHMQFGVFMAVNIRITVFRGVTLPDYPASHPMLMNWVPAVVVKYFGVITGNMSLLEICRPLFQRNKYLFLLS
jgi:hypothetical protein